MEFDIVSFALDGVLGAVIALLLRFNALKRLDLNLKKLGMSLGVEGIDSNEEPSQASGVLVVYINTNSKET